MKGEVRRALTVLGVLFGLVLALPAAAGAATITAGITVDEDSVIDPPDTGCSLREAITAANTDGSYGGCVAVGGAVDEGPDTIVLVNGGVYGRSRLGAGEDANATGDLDFRDDDAGQVEDVTFQTGPDGATIQGTGTEAGDRVLDIAAAGAGALTVTLSRVEILSGHPLAPGSGGGIRNFSGLNLSDSFLRLNSTGTTGGGIENAGTANVTNSTLAGNFAGGNGAGLDNFGGTTTLNNVTVAFNEADSGGPAGGDGGGIYEFGGTINLSNTVVASNRNGSYPWTAPDCAGTPTSLGYNLIGDITGCGWASNTGDITSILLPGLGITAENGGPTRTIALLPGSPAIDHGNPATPGSGGSACLATDQRGVGRPLGTFCDIGAFEATAPPQTTTVPAPAAAVPAVKKKCKKKKKKRRSITAKKKKCKKKKRK